MNNKHLSVNTFISFFACLLGFSSGSIALAQEVKPQTVINNSLLKTISNRDFNKQTYFDHIENGVIMPPIEFEYELSEDGSQLKVGNILFEKSTFDVALFPQSKLHPLLDKVLTAEQSKLWTLLVLWPEALLSSGTLEILSQNGAVLWTENINTEEIEKWKEQRTLWRTKVNNLKGKMAKLPGFLGMPYALLDVEKNGLFSNVKGPFRFCFSNQQGESKTKMCSQFYGVKKVASGYQFGKIGQKSVEHHVKINGKLHPLKQSFPVDLVKPLMFQAQLSSGESYEFKSIPAPLRLTDIVDTKNPSIVRLRGYDTRPLLKLVVLNSDKEGDITKFLGFESTIKDSRVFWVAETPIKDTKIYLPGQGGGVFKQRLELSQIPVRQSRVYLHANTPKGTYIDGMKIEGRKQPASVVTSSENSVASDKKDPTHFTWNFKATETGKLNRSYLDVNFQGKNYKSYYEIFRGYPREFSFRTSGVASTDGMIILGELSYNQWFEDIFKLNNAAYTRQRWGVSGKYFKSLSDVKTDAKGGTGALSAMVLDLKYRMTPGLWERDETLGLIGGYQNFTFGTASAAMLGVGGFWARSMPRVFDKIFNMIPFMRYPKWVDMEMIYYVMPMDSNIQLNSPLSLNFHGKILWTDTIYGEAGFGYKRYAITDIANKAELNTFYGTVGLGINF